MKISKQYIFAIFVIIFVLMAGIFYMPKFGIAQLNSDKNVKELSSEIKNKQEEIESLREKISIYEENLAKERSKASSLKNQIYILEQQIQKKRTEIELLEGEIEKVNLEIQETKNEIKQAEKEIADKKNKLAKFLRKLYQFDQKNDLEVVLLNESISDFFSQIQATQAIQSQVNTNLINLKNLKKDLYQSQQELTQKKEELDELHISLVSQEESIEDQQYTKEYLLTQTRRSESRYQSLVQELKAEQAQINAEIVSLEKKIRQKLSGNDKLKLEALGEVQFIWPVPSRYVTAQFHDPDYPFRHIFEHPAIDIRASQGTPLRAADSGYVAKVKNGGRYGYSYIMIVHNDGFATVYGHVSKVYVAPDQFVTQGEIIGATGGMPGTPGAGRLTTGPHLHLEVRKGGIPVNPLDYLP